MAGVVGRRYAVPAESAVHLLFLMACSDYDVQKRLPGANGEAAAPVIEVDPPELVFDALDPGASTALPLTVTNVGNVVLHVEHLALTGSTAFSLVDTDAAGALTATLDPGASATWTVSFSPVNPDDEGELSIFSDDPERGTVLVPVSGAANVPELLVYPNPAGFGTVPIGCSLTKPMHLYNAGVAPLVVEAVAEDGEGWSVTLPFTLPLTIAPGEEASVDVTFAPSEVGRAPGALYVTSNDFVPLRTAAQAGEGALDGSVIESFAQGDGPWERTDILLYVDGSCSMSDDQRNLAENFGSFAESLAGVALDWQMIVATADDGCANGEWFDADHIDAAALIGAVQGPTGTYTEAGLTIADHALARTAAGGCNDGFLRADAKTTLILVSDEPEQSREAVDALVDSIRASAPTATIHSVVGDVPRGCGSAAPGIGYDVASGMTGGAFLSICDADWGSYFATIAERASTGQTDTFPLESWPDPDTLSVEVGGAPSTAWRYDSVENAIVFDAGAVPAPLAIITVSYALDVSCEG